jgi:hypothetical protein
MSKKKLTAEEAKKILFEYPDADLSGFDVDGDIEALAAEAGAAALEAVAKKIEGASGGKT